MLAFELFGMDSSLIEAFAQTSPLQADHAQQANREPLVFAPK
jgi:hypothetical protein